MQISQLVVGDLYERLPALAELDVTEWMENSRDMNMTMYLIIDMCSAGEVSYLHGLGRCIERFNRLRY